MKRSKELRAHQTKPEQLMWYLLRDRRLMGFKFRRQQAIGPYILDFFCPQLRLALELDGGGHNTPESILYDQRRTQFLKSNGIEVLRFWNTQVFRETEAVLDTIYRFLEKASNAHPSPHPLPQGERENPL